MDAQKVRFELGKYKEGNRILVVSIDWEVRYKKAEATTVDFEKVGEYYELGISGDIREVRAKEMEQAGQIQDTLWDLYNRKILTLSISEPDFYRLMGIWQRFHLNDLVNDWDRWLLLPLPKFVFDFGEKLEKHKKGHLI